MDHPEKAKESREFKINFYSGYREEETPRSIHVGNREFQIEEILWRKRAFDPKSGRISEIFKCKIEGEVVEIRREEQGEWSIHFSKNSSIPSKI